MNEITGNTEILEEDFPPFNAPPPRVPPLNADIPPNEVASDVPTLNANISSDELSMPVNQSIDSDQYVLAEGQAPTAPVHIQQQDPTHAESVTTVDIPYSPPVSPETEIVSPEIKGNVEAYTGNISSTPTFDRMYEAAKEAAVAGGAAGQAEIINKIINNVYSSDRGGFEYKKNTELMIIAKDQIPVFVSEEDALDAGYLAQGDLYAIASVDPKGHVKVYSRKGRDHVTNTQVASQASYDFFNWVERGGTEIGREALRVTQGLGTGVGNLIDMVPLLTMAAFVESQPLNYARLALQKWLGTETEVAEAKAQIRESREWRMSKEGPLNADLAKLYSEYQQFAKDFEEAYTSLGLWQGVERKRSFLGRSSAPFAEEAIFGRIFAAIKFARGRKLLKKQWGDYGPTQVDLYDPKVVSKELNIPIKKAKKLIERHRLGYSKELRLHYVLREYEAAAGFALGSVALTDVDEAGNPTDTSFNWLALAGGFGGAVVGGPTRVVANLVKNNRWQALGLYYKLLDVTTRRSGQTDKQAYTRQRLYLRARGLSNVQINQLENDGQFKMAVDNFMSQEETGDLKALYAHIETLSDDVQKELTIMARESFESLAEVTIHAREKMGIDADVYVDTILGLARIQVAKEQLLISKSGLFSKMWEKAIPRELEELARNEAMLQASLTDMLNEITMKLNKGDIGKHTNEVNTRTIQFFEQMSSISKRLIARADISFESLRANVDLQESAMTKQAYSEKETAVNSINPRRPSTVDSSGNPESETAQFVNESDTILLGKNKKGERIDTDDNPSIRKSFYDISEDLWDRIDDTVEFETKDFFVDMVEDFVNNPIMVAEIFNISTGGLKTPAMKRIINAVTQGNLNYLKINDIPNLESMLNKAHADDPNIAESIRDTLKDIDTPERQLDFLKNEINNLSLTQKANFIPSTMTLKEVKLLHSYLSKKTTTGAPQDVHNYSKHIESLDNIMNNPIEGGTHTKEQVEQYLKARKLYVLHSDVWKRGPLRRITNTNAIGEDLDPIESWVKLFIKYDDKIDYNASIFEKLRKGPPVGYNDQGEMIYKELTQEQSKFLDDSMAKTIAEAVQEGTISFTGLQKVIDKYGSGPGGMGVLNSKQTDSLIAHRNSGFGQITDLMTSSQLKIKQVTRQIKNLENITKRSISGSFPARLDDLSELGDSSSIIEYLNKTVTFPDLTEDQLKPFAALYKADYLSLNEVGELVNIKNANKIVTGFEYIKIITNDFKGLTYDQIKKTFPKGSTDEEIRRAVRESAEQSKIIKESLDTILLDNILKNVLEPTNTKEVIGNTLDLKKLVNSVKFSEKLDEIAAIRYEILGETDNSLLSKIYLASVSLQKARQGLGSAEISDLYKPTTGSATISRVYAWQRGVVGLRYLLGESALKMLRKDQSMSMLRVLTDKDAAAILVLKMEAGELPKSMRGKDIFFLHINPQAAYRAVAFATSMELEQLKELFSEKEIVAYYNSDTGVPPDSVYKKAYAISEELKTKGLLTGTVTERGERIRPLRVPSRSRIPPDAERKRKVMLHREMSNLMRRKKV